MSLGHPFHDVLRVWGVFDSTKIVASSIPSRLMASRLVGQQPGAS